MGYVYAAAAIVLVALACIVIGVLMMKGSVKVPDDKKEKVTILSILASMLMGLGAIVLALKPGWSKELKDRQATKSAK